jgi:hypothetical protein
MSIAETKTEDKEVVIEAFSAWSVNGHTIVPPSDTKKVVIPSPPSVNYAPINPRPAILYLTESTIIPDSAEAERLKAYALENKVVFVCPETGNNAESLAQVYDWAVKRATKLNVVKDQVSVKSDAASLDLAKTVVAEATDEGYTVEDAEILIF